MSSSQGILNLVHEAGGHIYHIMVGLRAELRHREEVVGYDVSVYAFGDDLFEKLPSAFHQCDRSEGFQDAVVRLLGFVDHHNGGKLPRMGASVYAEIKEVR
jgi:hypothetical protein